MLSAGFGAVDVVVDVDAVVVGVGTVLDFGCFVVDVDAVEAADDSVVALSC